jgi:hypothetical protein
MEVHHHTHASHGKKSWKAYLWEFLMLFLAVFCGFLAEYQLEHMIEHSKEKEYIESMVADLKTDSIRIANVIGRNKRQVEGLDSLLRNIYHTPYTDSSLRTLYYLEETYTLNQNLLYFTKGTVLQLKNSGGFRLIRKRAVADSILSYDNTTERVENQGDAVEFTSRKLLDLFVKVFDGKYTMSYERATYPEILNSDIKFNLLTTDYVIIREYANLVKFKRDVTKNYIRQLTSLQSRMPGIISFLEEAYHLK